MDGQDTGRRFPTTSWTLVFRARDRREELEALLRRYWSPIYAYVRRKGRDAHEAADLTQEFLVQVFLGRDLVSRADPARGRFRAFLTRSLDRFLIDEHRREHGRGGEKRPELVPRDGKDLEAAEPSTDQDPARAFDSQWARVLLEESIHRTERACKAEGLSRHWEAFESRVLRPILDGSTSPAVSALVDSLGASDSAEVSSMVHTVKRKFQRVFHQTIAETVEDESEIEDEIREVLALLSLPA